MTFLFSIFIVKIRNFFGTYSEDMCVAIMADIPVISKLENSEIKCELGEDPVGVLISDATGSKCEFTTFLFRFIFDPPASEEICVRQRILEMVLSTSHQNANTAAGSAFQTLVKYGISTANVLGHIRDTVAMNTKMDELLRSFGLFDFLFSFLCICHLSSCAGNELFSDGTLPVLALFWRTLQSVLRSKRACDLWANRTGTSPPSYSEIKWWNKFDCVELFQKEFDHLLPWGMQLLEEGIALESSGKLVNLLANPGLVHYLRIEMNAYCFVGNPLRHICYALEGDNELTFITFETVLKVTGHFEFNFPNMPQIDALAQEAVTWAASSEGVQELEDAATRLADAEAAAAAGPPLTTVVPPRPQRRIVGEAAAVRARRQAAELVERQAQQQKLDEAKQLAEEAVVAAQVAAPPTTVLGWQQYAKSQVEQSMSYFFRRLRDEDEYAPQMRVFEAASVMHPRAIAQLTLEVAQRRLALIKEHELFKRDEQMVVTLLAELPALKEDAEIWMESNRFFPSGTIIHARRDARFQNRTKGTVVEYDTESDAYVVEFVMEAQVVRERISSCCIHGPVFSVLRYLKQKRLRFPATFKAAKILALFQPSSAAAERVFSLLEKVFGKKGSRTCALKDLIDATLKLMTHDRRA